MAGARDFLTKISGITTLVRSISAFTGNANEVISTDSGGLVSEDLLPEPTVQNFVWEVGRNQNNVTEQALRRAGNTPTNQSPFTCAFDTNLYYVSAGCNTAEADASTFDIAIRVNGGGSTVIASIPGTGDDVQTSLDIDLSTGDRVEIRMENESTGINRPYACLYGRRR